MKYCEILDYRCWKCKFITKKMYFFLFDAKIQENYGSYTWTIINKQKIFN